MKYKNIGRTTRDLADGSILEPGAEVTLSDKDAKANKYLIDDGVLIPIEGGKKSGRRAEDGTARDADPAS